MLGKLCEIAKKTGATDIHLYGGEPALFRVNGIIKPETSILVTNEDIKKVILATSSAKARGILKFSKQVTYAAELEGMGRARFSVFVERGHFAVSIRFITNKLYDLKDLGFSDVLIRELMNMRGLILVGSPSGEGKSTTIASIVDYINQNLEKSIVTVENPVEYVYKQKRSFILQRSVHLDTKNFFTGISESAKLRPDILVSDSLEYADAFDTALSFCESGGTVIAGTEGGDALQIFDRIVNSRIPAERENTRVRLATQLALIVSQRLIELNDGRREAIFDIMVNVPQLRALIRANNTTMFRTLQDKDKAHGMKSFDSQLKILLKRGSISRSAALSYAVTKQDFV